MFVVEHVALRRRKACYVAPTCQTLCDYSISTASWPSSLLSCEAPLPLARSRRRSMLRDALGVLLTAVTIAVLVHVNSAAANITSLQSAISETGRDVHSETVATREALKAALDELAALRSAVESASTARLAQAAPAAPIRPAAAPAPPAAELPLPEFEVLSLEPRIFWFPNFLSEEACAFLRATAESRLQPSKVFTWAQQRSAVVDPSTRSSHTYKLTDAELQTAPAREFRAKLARETKVSEAHQEGIEVQRYRQAAPGAEGARGGFYSVHYDSAEAQRTRIATLVAYLEDTPEGGETIFPLVERSDDPARAGQATARTTLSKWELSELGRSRFFDACSDDNSTYLKVSTSPGRAHCGSFESYFRVCGAGWRAE